MGERRLKFSAISSAVILAMIIVVLNPRMVGASEVDFLADENPDDDVMRYGVNYLSTHCHYEAGYLSDWELDRDFALFKQQRFEYVTLVAVWSYLEPQMGTYNDLALNDLARVCDFASKYDLRVIIDFYTAMQNSSFTMPTWLSPRKFETVFTNETARQAWLSYLDYCASRLNSSKSIWSWHMMNEPARGEWACDVTVETYLQLWSEMRMIFKSYSDRPVSIRFAAEVFGGRQQFDGFRFHPEIYDICDYIALNWYENEARGYTREVLGEVVSEIKQHSSALLSEFGFETDEDELQASFYHEYLEFFKSVGLRDCIAWMWRADHVSPNPQPPGGGYNLAGDVYGEPRTAFYRMDVLPPVVSVQIVEDGANAFGNAVLTLLVSEPTSWIGYSLDGAANVSIGGNTMAVGLSEGSHSIVLYVSDISGNMAVSNLTLYSPGRLIQNAFPVLEETGLNEAPHLDGQMSLPASPQTSPSSQPQPSSSSSPQAYSPPLLSTPAPTLSPSPLSVDKPIANGEMPFFGGYAIVVIVIVVAAVAMVQRKLRK